MTNRMKTACLFGGQGSQYIGMGQEFYEADEDCRRLFTIASEVMGYDMAELCFYGEEETFQHEIYSLPSMLTIDLCAFTLAVKRGFSFSGRGRLLARRICRLSGGASRLCTQFVRVG